MSITGVKDSVFYTNHTLNFGGKIVSLDTPLVMGILNVTPDSFYDGGTNAQEKGLLDKAGKMLDEGATILDVGGYSSRPGATHISQEEELNRVLPAIKAILKEEPKAIISVDTFRAEVAKQALESGALMINDISGGDLDDGMFSVVTKYRVPYVMMHMKGTPQTMASETNYEDLIMEISNYFQVKLFKLHALGATDIIADLGFGFAKTREQNFFLLKNLSVFKHLGCPIMTGVSRKSMVWKTLGTQATEALNGTTALHMFALMQGSTILRVHDVKEAMEVIKLATELR